MKYIIGKSTRKDREIMQLKSIGEEHTDLQGDFRVVNIQGDSETTYAGHIKEHYLSKEDSDGTCYDFYELDKAVTVSDLFSETADRLNGDINELLMIIGGTPVNERGKWFDRIKALYDDGKVADLKLYVKNGLITPAEYEEICGEPYEE